MFSKIIQVRSENMKHWPADQVDSPKESKSFIFGHQKFQLDMSEFSSRGFLFYNPENMTLEEMAVIDLLADFISQYPKDKLEFCQFREFDFFVRDQNSLEPFPEQFQINIIETLFQELLFLQKEGPVGKITLDKLTKIQQILAIESFLTALKPKYWNENVSIKLADLDQKIISLEVEAPGDLELYIDKVQESLIDFFQDYELNCILANNI